MNRLSQLYLLIHCSSLKYYACRKSSISGQNIAAEIRSYSLLISKSDVRNIFPNARLGPARLKTKPDTSRLTPD